MEFKWLFIIEIKYSPAIISLILDLNISYYKDYTATILYLCYRKYIEEICNLIEKAKQFNCKACVESGAQYYRDNICTIVANSNELIYFFKSEIYKIF